MAVYQDQCAHVLFALVPIAVVLPYRAGQNLLAPCWIMAVLRILQPSLFSAHESYRRSNVRMCAPLALPQVPVYLVPCLPCTVRSCACSGRAAPKGWPKPAALQWRAPTIRTVCTRVCGCGSGTRHACQARLGQTPAHIHRHTHTRTHVRQGAQDACKANQTDSRTNVRTHCDCALRSRLCACKARCHTAYVPIYMHAVGHNSRCWCVKHAAV